MAKRNETYKAVLTPDQYTQFEKMGMGHRRGFGGGGPRMGMGMGARNS